MSMNEKNRTIIIVGIALALGLLAVFAVPSRTPAAEFAEQDTPFYPEFDPQKVSSVEVISHGDGAAETFLVQKNADGSWIIPSHEGYPADAERQLDRTAGIVNGLKRGDIRSRLERDFGKFGVVDPTIDGFVEEEYGKRVIVKAAGQAVSDLIIGKRVEGDWGSHYVRKPDSTDVYTAKIDASNISTRFADWVETDVLQLEGAQIKEVTSSTYELRGTMDPDTRTLSDIKSVNEESSVIVRQDGDWTMPGVDTAVEEFQKSEATDIASKLRSLTLVGVRRKPQRLTEQLNMLAEGTLKPQSNFGTEIGRGFYALFKTDGTYRTFGENGETVARCDDGIVYRLVWGQGIMGEADEVSSAPEDGEEALVDTGVQEDGDETDTDIVQHRFLWVDVDFDESLVGPKPVEPVKPDTAASGDENETGDEPVAAEDDEPATETAGTEDAEEETEEADEDSTPDPMAEYEKALEDYNEDLESYNEKIEKGRERVSDLRQRFNEWYYLVSSDAFETVHFERADLVKAKPEPEPEEGDQEDDAAPDTGESDDADGGESGEGEPDTGTEPANE